jgi:dihydrofolate reductase
VSAAERTRQSQNIAIVLIAAVGENGVIGRGGGLPWKLKSDLKQFRAATLGKPIVMGRNTYLAVGKPLDQRTNIVVSRDASFAAPGILVARDLNAALEAARGDALRRGAGEIAIIGGAEIYKQVMPRADRLVITRVHMNPEGDTVFPPIDPADWREVERREFQQSAGDEAGFTVIVYERST